MTSTHVKRWCVSLISISIAILFAVIPTGAQPAWSDCINDGDVNRDGHVTAGDAQLAFYITLEIYSPTPEEACAADCNGDGDVTSGDAQSIFLVVLDLDECADSLPVQVECIYIAPGTFIQGSPLTEPCRGTDEVQHPVTLTRGFHLMNTEVTRRMWADLKTVQPDLPRDPSNESLSPDMNHPVQEVTWFEAVLFANLLSLQHGYDRCYYADETFTIPIDITNYQSGPHFCDFLADGYRLPTEAEWEYAARAGTTGPFSCDEDNYTDDTCPYCVPGMLPVLEQYAVFCPNRVPLPGGPEQVGSKLPNPWGLYDLHGNVWEWCWDWYGPYPEDAVSDPQGPESGFNRVSRGGFFAYIARYARSAVRTEYCVPGARSISIGFRLARSVP